MSYGAISFYLDHCVRTPVFKMVCGDFRYIAYDSSDPRHVRRQGNTDPLFTADVVQKVDVLNREIFQAAALLGEMLQNMEHTGRTKEQITEAFEKARWMLGEQMANIIATESVNLRQDLNALLVQVVLQIAITTWCRFVISSWKPGDTTVEDVLAAIYSEICQVGK